MTGEHLKTIMYNQGRADALDLQNRSSSLSGTELNAEDDKIPSFKAAVEQKNMMNRKAGQADGFVCKSSAGRVVRLIQNYDSNIYKAEPEELPAQWRMVWSTDPAKAKPFIASSTSYYNKGDCCLNAAGNPRKSKIDVNTFDPDVSPEFWEDPYKEGGA
jgi:hypothetical protein